MRLGDGVNVGLLERHIKQDHIKIIAAQFHDAFVAQNFMAAISQTDDGGIKCAAAQIVDQQIFAFGGAAFAEDVMRVFDAGGRWFVHHAADFKTSAAKCLQRDEALITIGVGGDRNHRDEFVFFLKA